MTWQIISKKGRKLVCKIKKGATIEMATPHTMKHYIFNK